MVPTSRSSHAAASRVPVEEHLPTLPWNLRVVWVWRDYLFSPPGSIGRVEQRGRLNLHHKQLGTPAALLSSPSSKRTKETTSTTRR